ncbi:hypothetical protein ACFQHV_03330 [Promicromonospora thailandica]|uniref:Uncharacterized protein n=1 Tax=Promicromonospora thailandica TaxID=765201 RepID=A0A9X2FY50_9MICO|nr:hypothetical protein [Promicromonospora thailandica]MCP2263309.1 hypothetical protein [Promicromonospora thailandica]
MTRDPEPGGAFVFDLVDDAEGPADPSGGAGAGGSDDGPGDRAADGPGAEGEGAGPVQPPARDRGRYLRVVGPVAALLAVVLGTGLAVEGVRDGARMERVREVPGGVVDLSVPLEQTWEWRGDVGPEQTADDWPMTVVAVLGGSIVFPSDEDVVALDPASGDLLWTVPLGDNPICGPLGAVHWGEVTARRLTCVAGPPLARVARVIEADGTVSAERTLDAADDARYGSVRPGPDGLLVRARRVGPPDAVDVSAARCTDDGCTGTVEDGRDLTLRAEEVGTGEVRWTVTVPFRPTGADLCTGWYESSWSGGNQNRTYDSTIDAESFGGTVTDGLVQLQGCGVESAVTPDGVVFGLDQDPGTWGVTDLRGGGYAVFEGDGRTVLRDAAGDVVGETEGYLTQATADDGTAPEVLLTTTEEERSAVEPDGTTLWTDDTAGVWQLFLARVGRTAVVQTMAGLEGLDLRTGETLWETVDSEQVGFGVRAFTDGRFVMLSDMFGGGPAMRVVDPVSGDVLWERALPGADVRTGPWADPDSALVAVAGHVVQITAGGVRGLG